jgi:hypothetical protein
LNQRIKELAEQAGMVKILEEHAHEYGNGMFENTPYPELEKFAQLIVKDCLYIVEPMEDSGDEWCVTLKGTAQAIKEHFGVEE